MGFKLKGKPYDEDNMNIAVYRKNLDDGSAAKSNHTGIILQTGLTPEVEGAAIEHEKVHQRQQKRGDLDYDENNFYWKGKTYPRKNLNEHNAKLPWEVEAYKESNKILNGKQTNKQMKEKFQLRNGEGNGAAFANLTSKGLMGASLDTDPIRSRTSVNEKDGETITRKTTSSGSITDRNLTVKEETNVKSKFKDPKEKQWAKDNPEKYKKLIEQKRERESMKEMTQVPVRENKISVTTKPRTPEKVKIKKTLTTEQRKNLEKNLKKRKRGGKGKSPKQKLSSTKFSNVCTFGKKC